MALVDFAMSIAAQGLPVFPVAANKKPAITKKNGGAGHLDATTDPAKIRALFAKAKNAKLIGVPTGAVSGRDIIDTDPRAGGDRWERENRHRLPDTLVHQSMNGGRHYVLQAAGVPCSQGVIAPGVDVRGEGGYVVWAGPGYSTINEAEIAPWPESLLALARPTSPPQPQRPVAKADPGKISDARLRGLLDELLGHLRTAREGEKHATLLRIAKTIGGFAHLFGMGDDPLVELMLDALPATVRDWKNAERTARAGLAHGRAAPLALDERPPPAGSRRGNPPPHPGPDGEAREEPPPDVADRPVIRCAADRLPQMIRDAARHLGAAAALRVHQRGGMLVTIANALRRDERGQELSMPRILPLKAGALRVKLAEACGWLKWNVRANDWVAALPPDAVIEGLLQVGEWNGVVELQGLAMVPALRPDGSIEFGPGLDPANGLYLHTRNLSIPPVPATPTKAEAEAALKRLEKPIRLLPFVGDVDRAVALALLLTAVVAPVLPRAPLFAVSATTAGSGKGLLINSAAMLATGQHAPAFSYGRHQEEFEKLLGAILLAGDPIANLDNVSRPLVSDKLCQILTEHLVGSRILGVSDAPPLPTRTLWTATGNNLELIGDLTRRSLICRLDAQCERPEQREFSFNPVTMVRRHRGELVGAALTVLRAFIMAGKPKVEAKTFGSFEVWGSAVRDPLVWLGRADPVESVETARATDHRLQDLYALAQAWAGTIGLRTPMTCAEAITRAEARDATTGAPMHPELADAIEAVAEDRGKPSKRRLGKYLANIKGRVIAGVFFEPATLQHGTGRWQLTDAKGSPSPKAQVDLVD